jgi:hypothetical protein
MIAAAVATFSCCCCSWRVPLLLHCPAYQFRLDPNNPCRNTAVMGSCTTEAQSKQHDIKQRANATKIRASFVAQSSIPLLG